MARKQIGLAVLAVGVAFSGAVAAQGFSGSGAAGYAQSQDWTASAGVKPEDSDDAVDAGRPDQRVARRRAGSATGGGDAAGPAARAR